MVAIDGAKLDELYQQVLRIEMDMMLEREESEKLSRVALLKVKKENQEIRALRESGQDELLESANSIFAWAKDFVRSPKGRKILSTLGEVIVFRAQYFDCKPREEKGYEAWLTCNCNGVLRYREFYNGIGKGRSKVLASSAQMVNRLRINLINFQGAKLCPRIRNPTSTYASFSTSKERGFAPLDTRKRG